MIERPRLLQAFLSAIDIRYERSECEIIEISLGRDTCSSRLISTAEQVTIANESLKIINPKLLTTKLNIYYYWPRNWANFIRETYSIGFYFDFPSVVYYCIQIIYP